MPSHGTVCKLHLFHKKDRPCRICVQAWGKPRGKAGTRRMHKQHVFVDMSSPLSSPSYHIYIWINEKIHAPSAELFMLLPTSWSVTCLVIPGQSNYALTRIPLRAVQQYRM